MSASRDIEALIDSMAKLPGLGPRSARRAVLHLIRKRDVRLAPLADLMRRVMETARECATCRNVCEADLCGPCADPKRANGQICVVQEVADLWAIERAGAYGGRYHVLGGTLSAHQQVGPEELGIPGLVERIASEGIKEVILALGATIEGQTTAHYVASCLEDRVEVTSLARGVPMGGELDYLDGGTIGAALSARTKL